MKIERWYLRRVGLSLTVAALLLAALLATTLFLGSTPYVAAVDTPIFINEIHYDNVGTDVGEGVEIAGPAGTDLTGYAVVFYNGNGGASYATLNLNGTVPDQQNGYGTLWFAQSSIQNGSPDGLALVAPGDLVIQFLSYEGVFTAADGPAAGMESTDIGVEQDNPVPEIGFTLQLTGTGRVYEDFTWSGPITRTEGAVNTNQTFAEPEPILTKAVTPTLISSGETVTYTVVLVNPSSTDEIGALLTDTLPSEVTFGSWIEQPAGATVSGNEITWSGTLSASTTITFAFTADHVGAPGEVITNTVQYDGSVALEAQATFEVEALFGDITFIYNDLEDVVQPGEAVYVAGDFNGWDTSATPLSADAAFETFSVTLPGLAAGDYGYKYIVYTDTVPSGPAQWEWLNTDDRSYTVSGDATVDDYRNVVVGWANLQWPETITTDMGTATEDIYGQLYINNVTNPPGEGRGLQAQVGYGESADPAAWDWYPMTFNTQVGDNDEFVGVLTPALPGVYSYTTRYDGNWGIGNPNAGWTYASLNGIPFDPSETGVMTVNFVSVPIAVARAGSDGEIFAIEGQVTVENGTWGFPEWALQDDSGGIAAYFTTSPMVSLGDTVQLIAPRGSYQNQEQMGNPLYFEIVASGPPVEPITYTTAEVAAGDTEGWLIQLEGVVSGYGGSCTSSHNFDLDDGSGAANIRIDYRAGINFCEMGIENGDTIGVIGFSTQFGAAYQVKPRFPEDILFTTPSISKEAPDTVGIGELLTYTITVENQLGFELDTVVVADTIPADVAFAYALDGGVEDAGVVTWNFAALPHGDTLTARFAVTATGDLGTVIVNDDYFVTAANYVTATVGSPVSTFTGDYLPIHQIQGEGFVSPYQGIVVPTEGVVVGFFEGNSSFGNFDAFFIQDPDGEGGLASDGIMVNPGLTDVGVSIGDMVRVNGEVQEYSEWDGPNCAAISDECQTQIAISGPADVDILSSGHVITPTVVEPPTGDVDAARLYWESLEGMLVTLPMTGVVVGPTSYGTVDVVRGDYGIDRVLRNTPYEGTPFGVRHFARYGNMPSPGTPNLIVGSVITNVTGPMGFSYGRYIAFTQWDDMWEEVSSVPAPDVEPTWPEATTGEFTAVTFNMYNFSSASGTHMDKVVRNIVNLGGPSILGLQEINVSAVITDLLANLAIEGYTYDYAYSHPDVGGHGVAVLWRTDHLSDVEWSTDFQGCSPYGSSSSTYDPIWDECRDLGEYPLFSRRPVVVTGTVQSSEGGMQIVVIGNHFKSKLGGLPSDLRRVGQAELVADLVDYFAAHTTPYVMVLGDLNDFEDSPPLEALYASGTLTNTWFSVAPENRYSYIFQGTSQILDHILVTTDLLEAMTAVSPIHTSADFPFNPFSGDASVVWRVSDHDQKAATFTVQVTYEVYLPLVMRNFGP